MKILRKVLILSLSLLFVIACGDPGAKKDGEGEKAANAVTQKVKLDFHIMSKCPFGVKVLQGITPVLEKMGDNIDFNVHYIGKETNGAPTSMHGEAEVKGNVLQLCADKVGDSAQWLEFVKCQNEDWRKIPEGWEKCATSAKLDVAKMKSCYEGDEGKQLILESFKLSQTKKATGSPTIFLADEPYRGGRSEASFARALCGKFTDAKPEYCANIPAPIKVPVTVVADKRCQGRTCDPKRFLAFITHTFEGAEVKELDYSDPEGKALYDKVGEKFLPIAIFGPSVEKEENGYKRLQRRLKKIEGGDYVYPLGSSGRPPWDPTAEICDDSQDNTGNGQVDCDDATCKDRKVCREEVKNTLNLFIMSQCPYGVRASDAMKDVLDNFGKDNKKIDFKLEFIGRNTDGKLTSMHGQKEVDENLRQICAQKYFNKNYKYMDYVYCRNAEYQKNRGKEDADAWKTCATGGINAAAIQKCSTGPEGQELLVASYKLADDLGITGSPNWLLNNRYDMSGRAPEQIRSQFCGKNVETKGCDNKLSATGPGASVPAGSCGGGAAPAPARRPVVAKPPAEKQPANLRPAPAKPAPAPVKPAVQ